MNKIMKLLVAGTMLGVLLCGDIAFAQEAVGAEEAATVVSEVASAPVAETPDMSAHFSDLRIGIDTVWVLVAGMLVFFMNAGFGLLESGLCRSKNCVNILAKNFIVFAASTISFWAIGWGLMFSDGLSWIGTGGVDGLKGLLFLQGADNSPALGAGCESMNPFSTEQYAGVYGAINWTPVPLWAKFFFQLVFAGTAATIVSGVVAERIKFHSFLVFSFVLVALVYPISGHWIWGGGFLSSMGFRDFAGSTVVHFVGGVAALAGALLLGARKGKYTKEGKVCPLPGHNMTSAALGVLVLWLGWFGFNPGSTMAASNGAAISHILVNTNIAAATGAMGALLASWILLRKPDFTMILNGCLAGLVAITAPCAFVSIGSGATIGFIGGILVVLAVVLLDKLKIDDPVGAIPVHLFNGVWGTLALGLFYDEQVATDIAALATGNTPWQQFVIQLQGVLCVGGFVLAASLLIWFVIKATLGLRVSEEEELEGLDFGEHGNTAYPDFQASSNKM